MNRLNNNFIWLKLADASYFIYLVLNAAVNLINLYNDWVLPSSVYELKYNHRRQSHLKLPIVLVQISDDVSHERGFVWHSSMSVRKAIYKHKHSHSKRNGISKNKILAIIPRDRGKQIRWGMFRAGMQ